MLFGASHISYLHSELFHAGNITFLSAEPGLEAIKKPHFNNFISKQKIPEYGFFILMAYQL